MSDMKEKQIGAGIGAGGISILAIFVVLCLATLAALSLVSANADRNLAEKNAQASVEYYQADARAEEILQKVLMTVQSEPDWEDSLKADGVSVEYQENTAVASYQVPINDSKSLFVQISLALSEKGTFTGEWDRMRWQTQVEEETASDGETLNLLQ